jgi:hypothetical protein
MPSGARMFAFAGCGHGPRRAGCVQPSDRGVVDGHNPWHRNTRPLSSATAAAKPACAPRWAQSEMPTTMACARASLLRWNASFSIGIGSRRRPRRGSRCSISSRASTIGAAVISRSGISPRSTTSVFTRPIPPHTSLPPCSRPSRTRPTGGPQVRRCARRPHLHAGGDGRMAPPGAEQKNDAKEQGKMPSDQTP